jgi:translation elongation factor EF-G
MNPVTTEIPADMADIAQEYRDKLIEAVSDFDDVIAEKYLSGEDISVNELMLGIRKATISLQFTGVIPGSAFKKKGVQRLLDCVVNYLPSPVDVPAMTNSPAWRSSFGRTLSWANWFSTASTRAQLRRACRCTTLVRAGVNACPVWC